VALISINRLLFGVSDATSDVIFKFDAEVKILECPLVAPHFLSSLGVEAAKFVKARRAKGSADRRCSRVAGQP
jgi:hypothetical protein